MKPALHEQILACHALPTLPAAAVRLLEVLSNDMVDVIEISKIISRDPALSGTAFVGVPPARAGEVKALLQRTLADQADRIQVAEALEELQGWLWAEAKGQALEPLYGKVPAPLRGLVELAYDYANRPIALGIRPEAVRVGENRPGDARLAMRMTMLEPVGAHALATFERDGWELTALLPREAGGPLRECPTNVEVCVDMNQAHLFDRDSGAWTLGSAVFPFRSSIFSFLCVFVVLWF